MERGQYLSVLDLRAIYRFRHAAHVSFEQLRVGFSQRFDCPVRVQLAQFLGLTTGFGYADPQLDDVLDVVVVYELGSANSGALAQVQDGEHEL